MIDPARIEAALAAARALIARSGAEKRHHVAAVALTEDGALHLGLSLESTVAWASICAEPSALARAAIDAPGAAIVACIAVNRDGVVVPPCSRCRELLADFAPGARIALPEDGGWRLVDLGTLMPHPYKGELRFTGGPA